jgi:predicted SAM-dependent methyltransferase
MISRGTALYASLRWGYQPIKQSILIARTHAEKLRRTRVLARYLAGDGFKGLHIGCGPFHHKGWLNTDLIGTPGIDFSLDIEKKLPIPSGAFDAVYSSEVIEHIPKETVIPFLREAHRILKSGGVIRLTTPDMVEVCRIALGLNEKCTVENLATTWLEDKNLTRDIWINAMFRSWGHQYIWDFDAMHDAMISVGYNKVERAQPQITNTGFPELANQETRYGIPPPPYGWQSSMIIEATK